jgi:hypothetical protein
MHGLSALSVENTLSMFFGLEASYSQIGKMEAQAKQLLTTWLSTMLPPSFNCQGLGFTCLLTRPDQYHALQYPGALAVNLSVVGEADRASASAP